MLAKIVWRNITKKKLQMFVIVLILIFTTCIPFLTLGAQNVTKDVVIKTSQKYVGESDIKITPKKGSNYSSFNLIESDEYDYIKGFVMQECTYQKNNAITLIGSDLNDIEEIWNIDGLAGEIDDIFVGNSAIASKGVLEKYGISVGDSIKVKVNNYNIEIRIVASVEPVGLFVDDGETEYMAVPKEFMQKRLYIGNRVNYALIKLHDSDKTESIINELKNGDYKNQEVDYSIKESDINTQINTQTSTYKILSVIVIILSVIIIMSIFKVVSYERMSGIATLRSLGSNRRKCNMLLATESLFYAIIACIIGCALGIVLLYKVTSLTMPDQFKNLKIDIRFDLIQFVISCSITVFVSLISSLFPVRNITKQAIRSLLFRTNTPKSFNVSVVKIPIGFVFIGLAMFIDRKMIKSNKLIFEIIFMILLIVGFMMVTSFIVRICFWILGCIFRKLSFDIAFFSVENIKQDSNFLTDIKVLIVSLGCFLIAFSTLNSAQDNTVDLYRDNAKFDVMVWYDSEESVQDIEHLVKKQKDVISLYTSPFSYDHPIDSTDYKFEKIQGIDSVQYLDYWYFNVSKGMDAAKILEQLNSGRKIVITEVMLERLEKQIGDSINIVFGEKIVPYQIVGTVNSLNTNGNNGFIADKYFKLDVEGTYYNDTSVFINSESENIIKELNNTLSEKDVMIISLDELEEKNYDSYKGIYLMLRVLTFIILGLCIVGIVNNRIINFFQRERVFCIQRSIGMSRAQLVKIITSEAALSGLVGGIMAMILGNMLVIILPYFIKAAGQTFEVDFSMNLSLTVIGLGIIISMISSFVLVVKKTKMNIVAGIKQE